MHGAGSLPSSAVRLALHPSLPQFWEPSLQRGAACTPPTPLSKTGPNAMLIGDSISMGSSGYSLFVQSMMETMTSGTLVGSLQHGGGFGNGGQMASSANGVAKVSSCIGNGTGTLAPKAWSVITYNAGLHDCDTHERVKAADYTANLKGIFETMKPAAHTAVFVTTTPYDMPLDKDGNPPLPAGINMSCVVEYNEIAKSIANEVGGIVVLDLYAYVESFCQAFPKDNATSGYGGNYTTCAIQTTGLHFFDAAPLPSGQQYTAFAIASAVARGLPASDIVNTTTPPVAAAPTAEDSTASCGTATAALNPKLPNVMVVGDALAAQWATPGLYDLLHLSSGIQKRGALAATQLGGGQAFHSGNPFATSADAASCVSQWLSGGKFDVIVLSSFGAADCAAGVQYQYHANYVQKIYDAAKAALAPGGTILWTTSPPSGTGVLEVDPACVAKQDAAALKVLAGKVTVRDFAAALGGVCGKSFKQCNLVQWSKTALTDAGAQFAAIEAAAGISPLLAPKWLALTTKK